MTGQMIVVFLTEFEVCERQTVRQCTPVSNATDIDQGCCGLWQVDTRDWGKWWPGGQVSQQTGVNRATIGFVQCELCQRGTIQMWLFSLAHNCQPWCLNVIRSWFFKHVALGADAFVLRQTSVLVPTNLSIGIVLFIEKGVVWYKNLKEFGAAWRDNDLGVCFVTWF